MSKLTKEEVSSWIRNLIPYLEKPVILSPEGYFDEDKIDPHPGAIIEYGDNLIPSNAITLITQTENLKILVELYKSIGD